MIEQAKEFHEFDKELLDLIESKNRLENLAYHIKNQIEDELLDEKLEKPDIDLLQNKSDKTLEWLYENQDEDNDLYRKKYDELELEFRNILSKKINFALADWIRYWRNSMDKNPSIDYFVKFVQWKL